MCVYEIKTSNNRALAGNKKKKKKKKTAINIHVDSFITWCILNA